MQQEWVRHCIPSNIELKASQAWELRPREKVLGRFTHPDGPEMLVLSSENGKGWYVGVASEYEPCAGPEPKWVDVTGACRFELDVPSGTTRIVDGLNLKNAPSGVVVGRFNQEQYRLTRIRALGEVFGLCRLALIVERKVEE